MPRYYDMDKLKQMIEARADTLIEGKEAFLKWLDSLPAADVVPAAIGEWLENDAGCKCSNCGWQGYGEHDSECMPQFCPGCFARMYSKFDGEEYAKVERFRREKEAHLAREIFEGLEKIFDDYGLEYFNSNLKRQIDEFILKYAEETDGKQA